MRNVLSSVVVCCGLAGLAVALPHTARAQSLLPGLDVELTCARRHLASAEDPAVSFFRNEGFEVLNKGRLKRDHFKSDYYGADVIGLDRVGNAIVDFTETIFGDDEYSYSVVVLYRPGTQRMAELEGRVERFAASLADTLGCRVSRTERHENALDSGKMFEDLLAIHRGWFEQAKHL